MDATIQNVREEAKIERVMVEGSSKTFHSGGSGNTTLTAQDIEKLEGLNRKEALILVREELANLLVVYQNLGGKITAITLPPGKEILAHSHILVLPADRAVDGSYSLSVPE